MSTDVILRAFRLEGPMQSKATLRLLVIPNVPGAPSLRVFCARVGFHELVFLFLLFNDPDVAEGGFQFGDLVVVYATERR